MSDQITKNDIPSEEELSPHYLLALKSGRSKSIKAVEREVSISLNLSREQKGFKVKGSKTTLLSNRLANVRRSLQNDGLVYSPKDGKVQLTDSGKAYLANASVSDVGTNDVSEHDGGGDSFISQSPMAVDVEPCSSMDAKGHIEADNSVAPNVTKSNVLVPHSGSEPQNGSTIKERVSSLGNKALAIAAAVIFAVAFSIGSCTGGGAAEKRADEKLAEMAEQWKADAAAEEAARAENAELSFVVKESDTADSSVKVVVRVTGEDDAGAKVNDYYNATPGTSYALEYGAGIYLIELVEKDIVNGDKVYKHDAVKVAYTDERNLQVDLVLEEDAELTKAKEEQRIKAEEEAKAKEEEAKAKAEEEAKAKAEAEAEAQAQAEAERQRVTRAGAAGAAAAASNTGHTVYITNTGSKYHASGCRYLKNSKIAIDEDDAIAQGYTRCSVCKP